MSIADKLKMIAENEQRVYNSGINKGFNIGYSQGHKEGYDSGYSVAYEKGKITGRSDEFADTYFATWVGANNTQPHPDSFWDGYQVDGQLRDYSHKFELWSGYQFRPRYPVIIEDGAASFLRFNNAGYNKQPFYNNFYLGYADVVDFSKAANVNLAFQEAVILRVKEIDISNAISASRMFYATEIQYIDKMVFPSDPNADTSEMFTRADFLTRIIVEGKIRQNNLNFQWSTRLTNESLESIIDALEDKSNDTSGTNWVITLGSANLEKLSIGVKHIAERKGWTLR